LEVEMREKSTELPPEEWRPVVGYEGLYEVSNYGRVRRSSDSPGHAHNWKAGRPVSIRLKGGYPYVSLWKSNATRSRHVHCLVAEAFIGARPIGLEVNHIDGDKLNPAVTNLEYVTSSQNTQHAYNTGLLVAARGERHGMARLTDGQVREIKRVLADSHTERVNRWMKDRSRGKTALYRRLAKEYGVHYITIHDIASGRAWGHIAP
jgi:hypothetical protein